MGRAKRVRRELSHAQHLDCCAYYNRKDLLSQCLDCVFAQSRPSDKVIIIDNCSSDGTADMLRAEWCDRVQVHSLSRNIGAAGGFNVGIRIAYQGGADFVWVMDDDVMPEPDALAKLLEADRFLADKGVPRAFVISSSRTEAYGRAPRGQPADGQRLREVALVPRTENGGGEAGDPCLDSSPALDHRAIWLAASTHVHLGRGFRIYASDHQATPGLLRGG
jgi:GT2 family glycosyltransferase